MDGIRQTGYTAQVTPLASPMRLPSGAEAFSCFRASIDDVEVPAVAILDVELTEDGRAACTALRLEQREDGPAVTAGALRKIPLGRLLGAAMSAASDATTAEQARSVRDHFAISREPRSGAPLSASDLEEVAQLYRAAVAKGKRPTKAVQEACNLSRSGASKRIKKARTAGLLGPAPGPRKAGEETGDE